MIHGVIHHWLPEELWAVEQAGYQRVQIGRLFGRFGSKTDKATLKGKR
jgi:hypothetical protein